MPFLVWVQGLKGPAPELWPELLISSSTSKQKPHLERHEIKPEEESLSLKELAERYPYKGERK